MRKRARAVLVATIVIVGWTGSSGWSGAANGSPEMQVAPNPATADQDVVVSSIDGCIANASVTVGASRDGAVIGSKTVTADGTGAWQATFPAGTFSPGSYVISASCAASSLVCPDGSVVPIGAECPPTQCPGGVIVPNGAECPDLVECTYGGQALACVPCPDGGTATDVSLCPPVDGAVPAPVGEAASVAGDVAAEGAPSAVLYAEVVLEVVAADTGVVTATPTFTG